MTPIRLATLVTASLLLSSGCAQEEDMSLAQELQIRANEIEAARQSEDQQQPQAVFDVALDDATENEESFASMIASQQQDQQPVAFDETLALDETTITPVDDPPSFDRATINAIDALTARIDIAQQTLQELAATVGDDRVAVARLIRNTSDRIEAVEKAQVESGNAPVVTQQIAVHELIPPALDELVDDDTRWHLELSRSNTTIDTMIAQAESYMSTIERARQALPALEILAKGFPDIAPEVANVRALAQQGQPRKAPTAPKSPDVPDLLYVDGERVVVRVKSGESISLYTGQIVSVKGSLLELVETEPATASARIKAGTSTHDLSLTRT